MYKISAHNLILADCYSGMGLGWLLIINDGEEDRRIKGIKDHIEAGDYFASLATVLDLTGQAVDKTSVTSSKRLKKLKKDLLHLQKNYRIVRK